MSWETFSRNVISDKRSFIQLVGVLKMWRTAAESSRADHLSVETWTRDGAQPSMHVNMHARTVIAIQGKTRLPKRIERNDRGTEGSTEFWFLNDNVGKGIIDLVFDHFRIHIFFGE